MFYKEHPHRFQGLPAIVIKAISVKLKMVGSARLKDSVNLLIDRNLLLNFVVVSPYLSGRQ